MALVILGIIIPIIGWFMLLPIGVIVMIAGLIMKEEVMVVPAPRPPEEVLLDADLVISEIEAISRKIMELSKGAKTNFELIDQYVACLKDAKLKIGVAGNIESSFAQIIGEVKRQLDATESAITDLEKSRVVYGVQAESLETKMAQERAKLEGSRANAEKWEDMLFKLRLKRDALAGLLRTELGSETTETIGLCLKVSMKYREKYGKAAEKKLKRDLTALSYRGMLREAALEELYRRVRSGEKPK